MQNNILSSFVPVLLGYWTLPSPVCYSFPCGEVDFKGVVMKTCRISIIIVLCLSGLSMSIAAQDKPQDRSVSGHQDFYNIWVPGVSSGFCYFWDAPDPYFAGGSFRFDIIYALDQSNPYAPLIDRGRIELYLDVGLFSSIPDQGDPEILLFKYVLGINTSFETPRILDRAFFIPYIGIELGGIFISGEGNGFQAVPVIGINLITLPGLTLSVDSGLMFNTVAFEKYLGIRTELHLNFVI